MKIIKDSICCKKKEIEKPTGGGPVNNELSSVVVNRGDTGTNMNIVKEICGSNGNYQIYYWEDIKVYANGISGRGYITKKNSTEIEGSIYVEIRSIGYIVKISSNNAIFQTIVEELYKKKLNKCSIVEFENIINNRPNFKDKRESFFDKIYFYFANIKMYKKVDGKKEYNKLINSSTMSDGGDKITYKGLKHAWKDWKDESFGKNTNLGFLGYFERFNPHCPEGCRSFFCSEKNPSYTSCIIIMLPDNNHFLKFKVGANRNELGGWEDVHRI